MAHKSIDSITEASLKSKPVMVAGPSRAGKSTLLHALGLLEGEVKKTEAMVYLSQAIDTPGEMISLPRYYNAVILNSVRAALVLFVMDGHRPARLPSEITRALKAPVLGVITKIDSAEPEGLVRAEQALKAAGVRDIFQVSAITRDGLPALREAMDIILEKTPRI